MSSCAFGKQLFHKELKHEFKQATIIPLKSKFMASVSYRLNSTTLTDSLRWGSSSLYLLRLSLRAEHKTRPHVVQGFVRTDKRTDVAEFLFGGQVLPAPCFASSLNSLLLHVFLKNYII